MAATPERLRGTVVAGTAEGGHTGMMGRAATGDVRAVAAAGATMLALSLLFWAAGALLPTALPGYTTSPLRVTGMALMLILIPSYLVAAIPIARRRSLALIEQLRPLVQDPAEVDAAVEMASSGLRRHWKAGTAVGIALGLLNTEPFAVAQSSLPVLEGSLSLGQLTMWWLIGLVGASRLAAARAFRRLGETVSFDLFQLESLRPLARSGVIDVVLVAGGLLLTPLQSLDAEFRWYNYSFGLMVGPPAAVFFLTWPLLGIHRRIQAERDERFELISSQLRAGKPESDEEAVRVEMLLAHRDRLRSTRTWPLDTRLLSRVLLYMVFPPLAWAGAALVERILDQVLSR